MLLGPDAFRGLCRARDLLAEIREHSLSIRDVAREAHMSPFHFIRQFEALFGITPHQFRIRSRLDQAKHLLALDQTSVSDICMEVGMSSVGSFSDLFARRFGAPPSAYRRHARTMVQVPGTLPPELFPGCLSLMGSLPPFAFSNCREAKAVDVRLECGNANQTHQHYGR
jgi:AraC-like DNA-binding protein